ncbi:S-layer homology domain-containing protein [Paenibacillus agaridevorans]|uniref:S-layer homology domain-containing protein n=1 Tax=Paenibacillus agaridevorans TaxID=171404 RepID=UPI001BE45615|nr:S-layer homology domain-containing protein [Paenibacillus agaridevorans]
MKKKTIPALLLAAILFGLNVTGALAAVNRLGTPPAGWQTSTPQENTFQVEGAEETFILLDNRQDDDSAFFIMTKEAYGARAFDPDRTTKFDVDDPNNIAYWLNHDFMQNGNGGRSLPAGIVEFIDRNHVWETEGCRSDSICPADYTTTAGIALLSQTEYIQYASKFGVRDGVGSSSEGWWLRTARGLSATSASLMLRVRTDDAALGQTHELAASYANAFVKPVFFLNEDFFAKVKLRVDTMGEQVKQTILSRYVPGQLQGWGTAQYSDEELVKIGFQLPQSIIVSDFERGIDGWTASTPQAVLVQDGSAPFEGAYAARWDADFSDGGAEVRLDRTLPVPIHINELRISFRTVDMNGVFLELSDTSGRTERYTVELDADGIWHEAAVANDAALGAIEKLSIVIPKERLNAGAAGGSLYLDQVKMLVPGELAGNGGFEQGLWLDRSAAVSIDTSLPHTGAQSARIEGGAAESYMSTIVRVDPSEPAELTVWIKTDGISKANAGHIEVVELDGYGAPIGDVKSIYVTDTETMDWSRIDASLGLVDSRAAFLKLFVRLEGGTAGSLYVDDVEIAAYSESVQLTFQQLGYIFDPEEVQIGLSIHHNASTEKTYTVLPSVPTDPQMFEPVEVIAAPGGENLSNIPLPGLKNGLHQLRVEIKEGQRSVKVLEQAFSVMPTYQPQFGDSESIAGISTHFALENRTGLNEAGLMDRAGFRTVRDELQWNKVEKTPGVLDFERHDGWVNELSDRGIQIIGVINGNLTYYSGLDGVTNSYKYGPRSMKELDGIANYAYETARHYKGKVDTFEIWNEPNLKGFWMPEPNVTDYAAMVKRVAEAIRLGNPDAVIIAGSVANQQGYTYLNDMLENGVFPYIDAISFHPYSWPNDPDTQYESKLQNYADTLKPFGAWKDLYVTEVNWHTADNIQGVSEELQARYLIKHYAISADHGLKVSSIYDWRNDGEDPLSNEHNYGITHADYSAKRSLIALNQFNRTLAAAQFIGEMDLGADLKAYAYLRDGKPILLMWSNDGEKTYDFDGETVKVTDMDGNPAGAQSNISVGENPVYVEGLSDEWLLKAVSSRLAKDYENWLAAAEAELGASAVADIRPAIAELKLYAEQLNGQSAMPSSTVVASLLTEHYSQGNLLIEQMGSGTLNNESVMSILYELYRAGEAWERLLSASADSQAMPAELASIADLSDVSAQIQDKVRLSGGGSLPFAEEVLRHAKKRNGLAVSYKAGGRVGPAIAWDKASSLLLQWSEKLAAFEAVNRTDVFIHVAPSAVTMHEGDQAEFKVTVSSDSAPIAGQIRIVDENGKSLGEERELVLAGGERKELTLGLEDTLDLKAGSYAFKIEIVQNGLVLQTQLLPVTVKSKFDLELLPSASTLSGLETIDVKVTNLFASTVTGGVALEAPEGWRLQTENIQVTLTAGAEQVVSFPVEQFARKPFNEYAFRMSIRDEDGEALISKESLLSFIVTAKANQPVDIGDRDAGLQAWQDAYPLYLNQPENPASEAQWQNGNASAKMYALWDDEAFYVLAKVYDDYMSNNMHGASIWNGDSVQLAFDTKNQKTTTYNADMYEYAFALTGTLEETFAFSAAGGKTPGARPGDWSNITRDEGRKLTLYTIRIPKSELTPMVLETGYVFGFNAAINDGDMLDRESYHEFTKGLASSKNPSHYYSWKLVEADIIRETEGVIVPRPIIPVDPERIRLNTSAASATTETASDGSRVTRFVFEADQVSDAFERLKEYAIGKRSIIIQTPQEESRVRVELPASVLAAAATSIQGAYVIVQSGAISYELPLAAIDWSDMATWPVGEEGESMYISISIHRHEDRDAARINQTLKDAGLRPLTVPVEFTVAAHSDDGKVELNDFGNTYVARMIPVDGAVNPAELSGVRLDPLTGESYFVPTVFERRDGLFMAKLMRPGNSIYTVVENKAHFADIAGHWAKGDIELMASKLVVKGRNEQQFAPDSRLTRAEFTALLVRSLGLEAAAPANSRFADLRQQDWFYGYVHAAYKAGLVDGVSESRFEPDAAVTREQIAVMTDRALKFARSGQSRAEATQGSGTTGLAPFNDRAEVSVWARTGVETMINAGLMSGISEHRFAPHESATRAQAAVLVKRLLLHLGFINN